MEVGYSSGLHSYEAFGGTVHGYRDTYEAFDGTVHIYTDIRPLGRLVVTQPQGFWRHATVHINTTADAFHGMLQFILTQQQMLLTAGYSSYLPNHKAFSVRLQFIATQQQMLLTACYSS